MGGNIFSGSASSMRGRWTFRLTALVVLTAFLNGCFTGQMVVNVAQREEPQASKSFILTADENAYTISRWWGTGLDTDHETLTIPRSDLPVGCKTARFFLNDSVHELRIAEPVSSDWVTGVQPPLPDDSYPHCAFLVSYGTFSGPPALAGVAVTSAAGLIAKDERQKPQPAAWALAPVAMVVDIYLFIGAVLTMPIWGTIGFLSGKNASEVKKKQRSELPPPVAACWTAIDDAMGTGTTSPQNSFAGFEWSSVKESAAYVLTTADELFTEDQPVPIDTRVTLRAGRVEFRSLWTDADVECGLQSGNVVATRVKPLM